MKREHIGGIVVLLGIIGLVYYLWKQPAGTAGLALRNAWKSVTGIVNADAGGSRAVAAMPDASTMSTTPTYLRRGYDPATNPAGIDVASFPGDGGILAQILNAPVGTVSTPGGNNGDVLPARERMFDIN